MQGGGGHGFGDQPQIRYSSRRALPDFRESPGSSPRDSDGGNSDRATPDTLKPRPRIGDIATLVKKAGDDEQDKLEIKKAEDDQQDKKALQTSDLVGPKPETSASVT